MADLERVNPHLVGHLDKINWEIVKISLEIESPYDIIKLEIINPPSSFS